MIESVMREVNNYFESDAYIGHFIINNDSLIGVTDLKNGQYYRITGSMFNDGVFQFGQESGLINEEFDGIIYGLRVPRAFVSLVNEISAWDNKYGNLVNSPYSSESYSNGSYSYTMSESGSNTRGWKSKFSAELNKWRKV